MDIKEYIKTELKNQQDIDCFGLTYAGKGKKEAKCYRFPSVIKKKEKKFEFSTSSSSQAEIRKNYKINITDKSGVAGILENLWIEEKLTADKKWIENMLVMLESSFTDDKVHLSSIGIKKSLDKTVESKFYVTLRRFESKTDVRGVYQTYNENINVFACMYQFLNLKTEAIHFIEDIAEQLQKGHYYPSLLGVNLAEQYYQLKIYYELFQEEYNFDEILEISLDKIQRICQRLDIDSEEMSEDIQIFHKEKYFVRGIAIPVKNGELNKEVKIYFAPMSRFE